MLLKNQRGEPLLLACVTSVCALSIEREHIYKPLRLYFAFSYLEQRLII